MASVFMNTKKIRGEESGRQWPAAAGVAAALVASMTVCVAPIDGARANPPTSNVIVVNPATTPALTRSVDDPGRIAYQSAVECVADKTACFFQFPVVPKGYRLVVQHVSVGLGFGADAKGAQVQLEGGGIFLTSFNAPPSFLGRIQIDQPVLQYIDAGSEPLVFTHSDINPSAGSVSAASLSGYLLDCATTPCQPIAQ